ncbi:hypothetical protein U9R90_20365 [Streptomyces sp. E11-3]|uniref:Rv1733c family protein n=1 Tax=Streptomyces sp. E11-3 TaxID=3110112 RepID=UPI00397F68A6
MRTVAGLWRWRRSALWRRTDRVEAWTALVAAVLIAVAVPLVGWTASARSADALRRSALAQHERHHQVPATVLRQRPQPPADPDPETSTDRAGHRRVVATWTAPDGTLHTETVAAALRSPEPGDRFTLWTDARGRVVAPPMDDHTVRTHAALAGIGAAAATAGLVEYVRRLVVRQLVRLRYTAWDRAWEKAGPDWGRTMGTGT